MGITQSCTTQSHFPDETSFGLTSWPSYNSLHMNVEYRYQSHYENVVKCVKIWCKIG